MKFNVFLMLLLAAVSLASGVASAHSNSYDASGRLSATKSQNGQAFYYHYDAAGNLLSVTTDLITPIAFDEPVNLAVGMEGLVDITGGRPMGAHVYSAKGLPAGLKINPVTGRITGLVSAAPGSYTVSYWAQAGKDKSEAQTMTVVVEGFPSSMVGSFDAMMLDAEEHPAGRLELTVTSKGSYSGKLLYLDGKSYSLKGALTVDGTSSSAVTVAALKRGRGLPPLKLETTIGDDDTISARLTARRIQVATSSFGARRGAFTKTNPAPWRGTYTMVMETTTWVPYTPDGVSYASLKIDDAGRMTFAGTTADGAALTGSFYGSASAAYLTFINPHRRPDSYYAGWLNLVNAAEPPAVNYRADAPGGSRFYWRKAANGRDKSYRAGFGPLAIDPIMLRWAPVAGQSLADRLGLPSSGEFGAIILGAGINSTGSATAGTGGAAVFPSGSDSFAGRPEIGAAGGSGSSDSAGATKETDEPNHNGRAGGASFWWKWTPSVSGTATINTNGSSFDTVMAIYTGDAVDALTWVASDDDNGVGTSSLVTISVTAGITYNIAVDGYSGQSGMVSLNVLAPADGSPVPQPNTYGVPAWLALSNANKITTAENAAAVIKGAVNPATGVFSASFSIKDQVVIKGKTKTITRKVPFKGVFLENPGGDIGGGFFLTPPLQSGEVLSGLGIFSVTPPRDKYP